MIIIADITTPDRKMFYQKIQIRGYLLSSSLQSRYAISMLISENFRNASSILTVGVVSEFGGCMLADSVWGQCLNLRLSKLGLCLWTKWHLDILCPNSSLFHCIFPPNVCVLSCIILEINKGLSRGCSSTETWSYPLKKKNASRG